MYHKLSDVERVFVSSRIDYWLDKACSAKTDGAEKFALRQADKYEVWLVQGVVEHSVYETIRNMMRYK